MTSKAVDQAVLGRTGLQVSVAGLGAGGDSRLGLTSIQRADLPGTARARLARLFRNVDHLSGQ